MLVRKTFKIAMLAAGSALIMGAPAGFADEAAGVAKFSTASEVSAYQVDYSPIAKFTNAFATTERGRTKIAYAAVADQGKGFMKTYKRYLSGVPVSQLTRNDQLAFWLNTRNMMVVDAMVNSKSRRRMSNLRGTPEAPGKMWTEKLITVEGVELSLQDIEKDIILANFADNPNVIFGLYQGTKASPTFPAKGFSAANVNAELEALGREFLDSRSGVKIRRSKAEVPAIIDWYSADVFGGDQAAARVHVASLLDSENATKFNAATQFETRKFSYSSDEFIIRQQRPTGDSFSSSSANTGGSSFGDGGGGGGGGS